MTERFHRLQRTIFLIAQTGLMVCCCLAAALTLNGGGSLRQIWFWFGTAFFVCMLDMPRACKPGLTRSMGERR